MAKVLSVFVVVAMSAPQAPGGVGGGQPAGGAPRSRIYGPGVNNRFFKPNPFQLQYAQQIANLVPQALIRINLDGSIDITDQYGRKADVVDQFGRELTDLID
ncbi:uncharacterized protein LOC143021507 [Oratosquilla oratoria]|uniref:uncharacterized protein LOC143021507 n=1 Tax=Oratosquilla oratoria TaxID=337810 RepID=UPI003F76A7A6